MTSFLAGVGIGVFVAVWVSLFAFLSSGSRAGEREFFDNIRAGAARQRRRELFRPS
jgi:hypothetical protein